MNPNARLTILFDCCHSGSACELPFVYRPDEEGNINLMDHLKKGKALVHAAGQLMRGGFSRDKIADAKMLLGGATDFFNGLHHARNEADEEGLAAENFAEDWDKEGKDVWMFSGCRDDQTSADATISGAATGAMSWAFIGTMREDPNLNYREVCAFRRLDTVSDHKISGWRTDGGADTAGYSREAGGELRADPAAELRRALRPGRASQGKHSDLLIR